MTLPSLRQWVVWGVPTPRACISHGSMIWTAREGVMDCLRQEATYLVQSWVEGVIIIIIVIVISMIIIFIIITIITIIHLPCPVSG